VNPETYLRPGLAIAIGLLIGLQRERAKGGPVGIRSFALIALSGYLIGLLSVNLGGWIVLGGFLFLAVVLSVGNLLASRTDAGEGAGITTEVAALLVFSLAVYLSDPANDRSPAVLFAGVAALLLHYKTPLHQFVRGMGPEDIRSVMLFVLITLVVLPVLPDRTFGPYDVLNPFRMWLMVVLIVGIGLGGYFAHRFAGGRVGTVLSGLLGGLVSSTATTVSAARLGKDDPTRTTAAALIVLLASSVSVVRVLVEIAAVDPGHLSQTGPPVAAFLAAFVLFTFLFYRRRSAEVVRLDPPGNPADLKSAVGFGLLYAGVLLAVAATREHLGSAGLYAVAVISGLTDVDAITLSTAGMVGRGSLDPGTGWRVILVATLANVAFKAAIVAFCGGRNLFRRTAPVFGLAFLAGLATIFFWPD